MITNEDNMKLMARYEDNHFDLAIVDPPYGYGDAKTDILNFRQTEQHREWNVAPNDDYFKELFRVSKNQIIWGGNYFPFIWDFGGRCFIYWHKGNPVPNFADGELAWTSFDKNAKQYDYRYYGNLEGNTSASKKFHPTQKPISLYEWILMNFAKEGDKILDTHLGSGSIAIACHNLGYDLTACELDKEYYDAAIKRINNHKQQIRMF
jgi:site-specific DNA-methyltransferase (adenine-specific)